MTELQPAHYTQGACHTAQGDRRLTSSLVCTEGVHTPAGGDLAVTTAGAGLTINIAAGSAFINGDNIATQGMYHVYNDGTVQRTLTAANPTDPRIDGVFAVVRDAQYSGVNNDWQIQVIAGTPSPAPTAPATPLSAIRLANVLVPAGFTGPFLSSAITDTRTAYQLCAGSIPADPNVAAQITSLEQHPFTSRTRTTTQLISDNTLTNVSWFDLVEDVPDGAGITYDSSARTFTVNKAGRYLVNAMISWATNGTGRREMRLTKNGAAVAVEVRAAAAQSFLTSAVHAVVNMAVGDTFSTEVLQSSGAGLDINGLSGRNYISVTYVGG